MASNFPIPPALPCTSYMPHHMQCREEKETQVGRHQSRKTRKSSVAASPKRPANTREALNRPFRCDTCGKRYKQIQGRNRHYREKHDPDLCVLCNLEWGRAYQYRDHLEAHHPDVDPDTIIGKAEGSRRRVASFARHTPQQQILPPVVEQYGRVRSEIEPYPPMLPSPAVAKPPTATPPRTMSSMISPEGVVEPCRFWGAPSREY